MGFGIHVTDTMFARQWFSGKASPSRIQGPQLETRSVFGILPNQRWENLLSNQEADIELD